MSYKQLYHALFAAIDDSLQLLENGNTAAAARVLQKALENAENEHLQYDIISEENDEKAGF